MDKQKVVIAGSGSAQAQKWFEAIEGIEVHVAGGEADQQGDTNIHSLFEQEFAKLHSCAPPAPRNRAERRELKRKGGRRT